MTLKRIFESPLFKLAVCAAAIPTLMTGCYSVIEQVGTTSIPSSKYFPAFTSDRAIDDWLSSVTTDSGKVVRDELGTYFHSVNGTKVNVTYLNKDDEVAIRGLLSGDVGLMEPLYKYDVDGVITPDWPETERRHRYLTSQARLRLLPLAETRNYHERIAYFAQTESSTLNNPFATTRDMLSGEAGLYNSKFEGQVLSKIRGDFNYLVVDASTAAYFFNARLRIPPYMMSISSLQTVQSTIEHYNSMDLVPRLVYSTSKKGGFRINSGCRVVDSQSAKRLRALAKAQIDVPYVSGISMVLKDRSATPAELAAEQGRFRNSQSELRQRRIDAEAACARGLSALQVSGAIRSQQLR